jgi:hypothetical protein
MEQSDREGYAGCIVEAAKMVTIFAACGWVITGLLRGSKLIYIVGGVLLSLVAFLLVKLGAILWVKKGR